VEILSSGFKNRYDYRKLQEWEVEGLRSVYYPSGKIAEEINYKNNVKTGVYKSFLRMEWYLKNQFIRIMNIMD
jgi:antitoxin component YwqK of YwqJK toxin-antitoxin module